MNLTKKISKKILVIVCVFVLGSILVPVATNRVVLAQAETDKSYTLLAPLPCIGGSGVSCPNGNGATTPTVSLKTYLQYAFNLLIALAAVAAVFMIVWGGFEYMGTDSWNKKNDARGRIWNAILGLIMVLSAYLILRTINPQLVQIPAELVPALKNPLSVSSVDDFYMRLQKESDGYVGTKQALDNQAVQIQNTIKQLEQQKYDLGIKRDNAINATDPNDPNYTGDKESAMTYIAAINNIDNQIADQKALLISTQANRTFTRKLEQMTTDTRSSDPAFMEQQISATRQIQSTYQQQLATETGGSNYIQAKSIDDMTNYTVGRMTILKYIDQFNIDSKAAGDVLSKQLDAEEKLTSNIDHYADPLVDKITDPALKLQLQQAIASAKSSFKVIK